MEMWRRVWRAGVPLLSTAGLEALHMALLTDDQRLAQGFTTSPPPLQAVSDWPLEAADSIALCFWLGDCKETVAEAEEAFAKWCYDVDQIMNEPAACRYYLNFWDDVPRYEAIAALLPEVLLALAQRRQQQEEPDANLPTGRAG